MWASLCRLGVINLGGDRGRGPVYVRIPPIASQFCAPQRKTPSAASGLVRRKKSLLDHLVGAQQEYLRMVKPMALAALRLITSSNFVGCSIGRSAGLAPLNILSTKV